MKRTLTAFLIGGAAALAVALPADARRTTCTGEAGSNRYGCAINLAKGATYSSEFGACGDPRRFVAYGGKYPDTDIGASADGRRKGKKVYLENKRAKLKVIVTIGRHRIVTTNYSRFRVRMEWDVQC